MEKKKYTLQEVQKMAKISPATLQEIMRMNGDHFKVEIQKGPNGEEEVLLDQDSLDRLLFIKQLRYPKALTRDEYMAKLRAPEVPRANRDKAIHMSDFMSATLDRLAGEMKALKGILGDLLSRHQQILRDLGRTQLENSHLHKEMETMRQRQHALLQELQRVVETGERPEVEDDDAKSVN